MRSRWLACITIVSIVGPPVLKRRRMPIEPLMFALAFAEGFTVQLVRLPPLVGFLAAGFVLNAMGLERTPALDTPSPTWA